MSKKEYMSENDFNDLLDAAKEMVEFKKNQADHWWNQKGGDISREKALDLLNKVPDSSPDSNDEI
jgi:hypothetical protein